MKKCGDIEENPGAEISYESFSQLSAKYKKTLSFIHTNFQDVTKKRMQLKSFVSDMGKNAVIGISKTWLKPDDDSFLWNVASSTHELFRCDRSRYNEKKKGGCVMLFVPLRLAPKESKDLNISDKSKFQSSWVECRNNFSNDCRSKMFLNATYNPLRANQIEFLQQLLTNFDRATIWFSLQLLNGKM